MVSRVRVPVSPLPLSSICRENAEKLKNQANQSTLFLSEDDVRVEEQRVTIDLPEAHVLSASLNEDETKLYDRDRGLIDFQGDDALSEEARRDAVEEIRDGVEQNSIIEQAQTNAEDSLRAFVISLGYEEVIFS